jgi:hypothetical protein
MSNGNSQIEVVERASLIGVRTFDGVKAELEAEARREGVTISLVAHRILARHCGYTLTGERASKEMAGQRGSAMRAT